MSTSRSYSIRDRAFRNAARLVQCAIDGEAPDFEQIPEGDEMPSEPKWIPCSKTTDIPDHEIMACDKYGEIMLGYLVYEDEQWLCSSDGCEMVDPIAWREKPESYREEGD